MNQKIFETQQRADELLREAVSIWRQSLQSDYLQDIEKDPVFSLLTTAMAYQTNAFDAEVERLKSEVLEDYLNMLRPHTVGNAIPATAVVSTTLQNGVDSLDLDDNIIFSLGQTAYPFVPLLHTKVVNLRTQSVIRMDGRRWKVSLKSDYPLRDLSYFSFAITNANFYSVSVTLKGHQLSLVKPWQYADLPLSKMFAVDSMIYNSQEIFNAYLLPFDLFARQNIRMFCMRPFKLEHYLQQETYTLDLVFEFFGIPDDFVFDASQLSLNTVLLCNVRKHEVTVSTQAPMFRIDQGQFLQMLRPSSDQLNAQTQISVRRVAADRFNAAGLIRLLQYLINKYDNDFYAFQHLQKWDAELSISRIKEQMVHLIEKVKASVGKTIPGTYLMLRFANRDSSHHVNLSIPYLTTDGSAVNNDLQAEASFLCEYGFDNLRTRIISTPMNGSDELSSAQDLESTTRYYVATHDRLVTQADIKLFCYNELATRYGIGRELVRVISVDYRQAQQYRRCGYEIVVDIVLIDNSFINRYFLSSIPQVELLFTKMIEVRSANIYPVQIRINVEQNLP